MIDLVSSHVTQPLSRWMITQLLFVQLVFVERNHQCAVSAIVPLQSITVGQIELMLKMQLTRLTELYDANKASISLSQYEFCFLSTVLFLRHLSLSLFSLKVRKRKIRATKLAKLSSTAQLWKDGLIFTIR